MPDQPLPAKPIPAPARPAGRVWTAGTLTYTSSALVVLALYLLLGDFAYWMRERSAAPVTQLMLKKFGASDMITGLFLLTIPGAVLLVVGPVVSYWSDNHRSRWGRRIPFLVVPAPFVALAMIGLAFSPTIGATLHGWFGGDPAGSRWAVLVVMGLCWTIFEIGVIVMNAVFNALMNDVVPRELLGRFFAMFRAAGLIAGVLFNYKIIGHAEENYTLILASIGVLYGIGFVVMCLGVKEGSYPPPAPVPAHSSSPALNAVREYFRDCFTKPYYLLVFVFLALANLAFMPVNTFGLYAAKGYQLSMETYGRYLVVTYICSFTLAFPLGWLADRFHALRVGLAALLLYAVFMLVAFFYIHDADSFGHMFLAHGVLSGCFFTGAAAVAQMLYPKLKFAQYAGAGGLVAALCNMTLGPALGGLLDGLGNDYRYVFLVGSGIALAALGIGGAVLYRWHRLGGQAGYEAPA
ncbi:Major Facilitator Superfamily protein [Lacunisphaera limnophila]|uniref:Major Facilitator Superfamily protein n=1 Tax=Lacunisphaera limnophila TaxID=1838286 RepID=A0A1D8AV46_9BACT|nr:MFS transporter [Lacunisphaera limnophila]AOS44769.1 Major Facilitator Superfamily protein [Lacunisphaera limnophila]